MEGETMSKTSDEQQRRLLGIETSPHGGERGLRDPYYKTKGTVNQARVDTSHDGRVDLMRGTFVIVQTTAGGVTETRLVLQGLAGTAGNRKLVYLIVTDDWRSGDEIIATCVQDSPGKAKADASARMDGWIEQNKDALRGFPKEGKK